MYTYDLDLYSESEEELKEMVRIFVEVCGSSNMKVNVNNELGDGVKLRGGIGV